MAISPQCKMLLEEPTTKELCYDFRRVRAAVMCRAWRIQQEEKIRFGEAIRRSWVEQKKLCAEAGAHV